MKAFLAGLMLLGAQAFACPNLTGTYTCTQEGQTSQIQMSQAVANGVTVYTIKDPTNASDPGGSLPADNTTYRLEDTADFKNGTIRGFCENKAFKVEQTGQIFDQGQHIGDVQAIISFSLMNGNLLQSTQGVFKTGSGDYPINAEVTCTRN